MTKRSSCFVALLVLGFGIQVGAMQNPAAPAAQGTQAARGAGRGAAAPTPPCGPNLTIKNVAPQSRCFELRTYTVREGSGSIDVLHARFREVTNRLFAKHGFTVIGYWQPVAKPDTLIYMLAFKDAAARDAAWGAFQVDPEWTKTVREMAVNVGVEAVFMSATDYSPMK